GADERRGQDPKRSPGRPETADQRRPLRPAARRRPPGHRNGLQGPGRATGERLCLQRGRLAPRTPALRASHSRACDQPTCHDSTYAGPAAARGAAEENPASHLTTTTTKRIDLRRCWLDAGQDLARADLDVRALLMGWAGAARRVG